MTPQPTSLTASQHAVLAAILAENTNRCVRPSRPHVAQNPDFSRVSDIVGKFAADAAAIIADNPRPCSGDAWGDWMGATYIEGPYYLHQNGHIDDLGLEITEAVMKRARGSRCPANSRGLALLDMLLRDAATTIRPLLAKQSSMVL